MKKPLPNLSSLRSILPAFIGLPLLLLTAQGYSQNVSGDLSNKGMPANSLAYNALSVPVPGNGEVYSKGTSETANGSAEDRPVAALRLAVGGQNVHVHGGSDGKLSLIFGGGVAPYQVKLGAGSAYAQQSSPYSISGLAAGTYTAYVRDAKGNEKSLRVTIAQPAAAAGK